jgi:RES domain-containing protein
MEVFRLTRQKFSGTLSGKGAALKGARWNSTGVELIYTAANRSLAMAEVAVHFSVGTIPDDYLMMTIEIPDDLKIKIVNPGTLPKKWNQFPHLSITQLIGDQFVAENKFCILRTPSAVTQGDYNYLLNPNHADFGGIKIIEEIRFPFDRRLF